jgi:cysteinyl-tRNA synthetase
MTNEQLEHFADIIAEKVFKLIMERQAEFDEQFIRQVQDAGQDIEITLQQDVFGNAKGETVEEYLLAELARLLTLQQSYLEKENYEKAAVIRDKIIKIELKLKNI